MGVGPPLDTTVEIPLATCVVDLPLIGSVTTVVGEGEMVSDTTEAVAHTHPGAAKGLLALALKSALRLKDPRGKQVETYTQMVFTPSHVCTMFHRSL